MSQATPEPGGVPPVPPRPQQQAADPIIESLRTSARPQLQHGFPAEADVPQPRYQASPLLPPHMLQQPQPQLQPIQMLPNGVAFDGALGSLMSAVLNQKRDVDTKFYMLLIPEAAAPAMQAFDSVEELRTAIKGHLGTSTYIFCFLGHALRITKGPFHFLQTPYGAVPLHDIPSPTDRESLTDGWVGPELPVTEFIRQSVAADEVIDDSADVAADGDDEDYVEDGELAGDIPHDETELF